MLIRTTVKVISGRINSDIIVQDKTNGDVMLFNAKFVNGIKVRASSKSSFMFEEFDGKPSHYVESEDTVANLKARGDYSWNSAFVDLPVYPNNDSTASTVTTSINCDSIRYVVKDALAPTTRSFVVYFEGGKRRKVLVGRNINQIYSLVDDGNLTTT